MSLASDTVSAHPEWYDPTKHRFGPTVNQHAVCLHCPNSTLVHFRDQGSHDAMHQTIEQSQDYEGAKAAVRQA